MECRVTMQRPDGSRARHVGHYPNPGMAMDVVQALHPDCSVNAAVGTSPLKVRCCEELGVCQSTVRTCASHEVCARKNSPFFFAPGAIDGGTSSDLQLEDSGWYFDFDWRDLAGAVTIVVVLGAICGWLA